jgi:hypothetical protein
MKTEQIYNLNQIQVAINFNAGAWLVICKSCQSFLAGSYIDSARVRLIPSGNSNIQLSNLSVENGMYCNNTSKITITMPNKNVYWNNRHYIIKST